MKKLGREFVWWICSVALALCSLALGIAVVRPEKVDPVAIWIAVLAFGTCLWFAGWLMFRWRPVCNRYRLHKRVERLRERVMRWLERQFPLLPSG